MAVVLLSIGEKQGETVLQLLLIHHRLDSCAQVGDCFGFPSNTHEAWARVWATMQRQQCQQGCASPLSPPSRPPGPCLPCPEKEVGPVGAARPSGLLEGRPFTRPLWESRGSCDDFTGSWCKKTSRGGRGRGEREGERVRAARSTFNLIAA
ncbi:unnamed protein product [Pleuronectes platessa]|uniref:Uncharacterized protein n=1 Tax=Pleuronectes platessa TaxID=8262 RepID=A0A9N7VFH3_PLEPL|nr:unnamed protein product [Pleuronectes platessa]